MVTIKCKASELVSKCTDMLSEEKDKDQADSILHILKHARVALFIGENSYVTLSANQVETIRYFMEKHGVY